ncbi:hypothetical protein F8S13_03020 [Chloroflexia bacterium SDU3-3]|nr:hypothetical protein F8S13_03020 [Chloroflexia bacterium SDU3-3]
MSLRFAAAARHLRALVHRVVLLAMVFSFGVPQHAPAVAQAASSAPQASPMANAAPASAAPPAQFRPAALQKAAQPIALSQTPNDAQNPEEELARGKPTSSNRATDCSEWSPDGSQQFCFPSSQANDGDFKSYWQAPFSLLPPQSFAKTKTADDESGSVYWQVDLGREYKITKIDILWANYDINPLPYEVQEVSDAANPVVIVAEKLPSGTHTVDTVDNRTARYIRINISPNDDHDWGPMIVEAQIYGILDMPEDQNKTKEVCPCQATQPNIGDPFNTRTGFLWYGATDLTVSSPGPKLSWSRSYNTSNSGTLAELLGNGWQHDYNIKLIPEDDPNNTENVVKIISPKGNTYRYQPNGDGTYQGLAGIYSTLAHDSVTGVYTQTDRTQERYVFGADGRLQVYIDAQGQRLNLEYGTSGDGALTAIRDAIHPTRAITITYFGKVPGNTIVEPSPVGRIRTVSDGVRTISYSYLNGDLATFTNVMGRATSYSYQNHMLTTVTNALGQVEMSAEYDSYDPSGRVIHQVLQDGQDITAAYADDATTITTTAATGEQQVERYVYGEDNVVTAQYLNGVLVKGSDFDAHFAPGATTDANGNTSQTTYNAMGLPEASTNALGQTARTIYNAQNQPITMTDTLNRVSSFAYDTAHNLIRQTTNITTANPLGFTTVYTYNVRYPGKNWLEEQTSSTKVTTRYTYNDLGQITEATVGYGQPGSQTTAYEYDALGRRTMLISYKGTVWQRKDKTVYNADNTVAQSIQNYVDGVFDSAKPSEDLVTTYGYDLLGRQVWTRDVLGHVSASHYNAQGKVDWSVQNLVPLTLDSQGQPVFQPFAPAHPDQNVATLMGYDGFGRTSLVTQTGILTGTFNPQTLTFSAATTRVTKTEYDSLSRPVTTTLNYRPGLPASADTNVQMLSVYDNVGNTTWSRDALGRWTHTEYDALNRPITTTLNYENGNPLTVDAANRTWTNGTDTDMVQVTRYTADGQVDRTIENYVDGVFTTTEPITDRVTLYQYDTLGRSAGTTQNYDPTQSTATDTNRTSATAYDAVTGRMVAQRDALGRWTRQEYDDLGRVVATIQNCRDAAGNPSATSCAPFSASRPDRNVKTTTSYDAFGRVDATADPLGVASHSDYDILGRVVASTQNYVPGGAVDSTTNITSRTGYNALGQTTVVTDALGAVTRMAYDGLGQTSVITDSLGHVTRQGADGTGAQRWSKAADGVISITQVDGLGRVVATIANYQDGAVAANEPADTDLISRTVYDRAGRALQEIDAAGVVKAYTYDLNDRLVAVTENVASSTCAHAPCNVVTRYAYDRAGNHTKVTDARGIVTRTMAYNAASELVSQRDGLGYETRYTYDRGGRLVGKVDPRGGDYSLTYAYDERDRQTGIAAGSSAKLSPISMAYDARGTRTSMTDGTGTTSFVPDALGRITEITAPSTGKVGYGYTALGQRRELTYPDGTKVTYTYTSSGQLYQVLNGTATLATYGYDATGRAKTFSRANGVTTSYDYDSVGRLKQSTTASTAKGTLAQFGYTLDRTGNRTAASEQLGSTLPITTSNVLTYTTNLNPQSLVTQDMNGDGARDVVVANAGNNTVQIFLNQGEGTLGAPSSQATNYNPRALVVGDFNEDGKVDVATASAGSNGVSILLGNGNGTLQAKQLIATGSDTYSIAAGDLNGDGHLDLVAANKGANTVSVLLGAGTGAFTVTSYTTGAEPRDVALADLNHDGHLDLAFVAYGARTMNVWLGAGNGTFASAQSYATGISPISIAVGDLNNDTHPDIAVALFGDTYTQVFLGAGNGTFTEAAHIPTAINNRRVVIADVTNDQVPDISTVIANNTTSWLQVYRGKGDGTFSADVKVSDVPNIFDLQLADMNADGLKDFVYINYLTYQLKVLRQQPSAARTIAYAYDGLGRLTGADASTGADYTYSYDLAGNRTDGGKTYNAANQLVGATYDAAGNLTSDGTTSYTYDALSRLSAQGTTTFDYNADGVLVAQASGGATTRYAQDLAAPLSQVLQVGATDYVYGAGRIAALGGTSYTWYAADALGSVRGTLDAAGDLHSLVSYDPWGQVESGTAPTFGFTGELQQGDQVYLRARWYNAARGGFDVARWSPRESFDEQPYSHNVYAYALGNPLLYTDPAGTCVLPDGTPCPSPADTPVPPTPAPTPTPRPVPNNPGGSDLGDGNQCLAGFFKQLSLNATWGLNPAAQVADGESVAMTVCRAVGDVGSMIWGSAEWFGGGTAAAGGVVVCAGGVTCFVGGPMAVVGAGIAAHGGVMATQGTWRLVSTISCAMMDSGGGGSGGGDDPAPAPTPAPTPEPSIDPWEQRLFKPDYNEQQIREIQERMQHWDRSSYDSVAHSIVDHAGRHGFGDNFLEYLRRADRFNTRGARRTPLDWQTIRYNKGNGEFLIIRDGKIVTYGINELR